MTPAERTRFDELVQQALDRLPPDIQALLEQIPVIVEDLPDPEILEQLGMTPEEADELCGLHTGTPETEKAMEHPDLPSEIQIYRMGILAEAGGWSGPKGEDAVREQIWITLLHEIGHQFGLDEDDLDRLGYS